MKFILIVSFLFLIQCKRSRLSESDTNLHQTKSNQQESLNQNKDVVEKSEMIMPVLYIVSDDDEYKDESFSQDMDEIANIIYDSLQDELNENEDNDALSLTNRGILKTLGKSQNAPKKRVLFHPDVAVKTFDVEKIRRKARKNPDKLNEVNVDTTRPLSQGTVSRKEVVQRPPLQRRSAFRTNTTPPLKYTSSEIDIEVIMPTSTVRGSDFDDVAKSKYLEEIGLEYRLNTPGVVTVKQGFRRPGLQEDPNPSDIEFTPWN